jgi:hypothetical protein
VKCVELSELIIKDQAFHYRLEDEKMEKIFKELPKIISQTLQDFKKSKNLGEFLILLEKVGEECNYYLKPLDKKKSKQFILTKKYELIETVQKSLDPADILLNIWYVNFINQVCCCLSN